MSKLIVRRTVLTTLLLGLAALPAVAQTITPGTDWWVTPANSQTIFLFPNGDVESLCGVPPASSWDHRVFFRGIPQAGADWDTAVARLDPATFSSSGNASTRIQVSGLHFTSISPLSTPCGVLSWTAGLSGTQPITVMNLTKTSATGGVFFATISVHVELRAFDSSGAYRGSLFYSRDLPDTGSGVAWSLGTGGAFRPGITPANTCVDVLRQKLLATDPTSRHYYFISSLISRGICTGK
jgi:hypothetical protein